MVNPRLLLEFCSKISIPEAEVEQADVLHRFHLSLDLGVEHLKPLSQADLLALTDHFGPALSLNIGIPDAVPLIEVEDGDVSSDDLQDDLRRIREQSAPLKLRVTITLDKKEILARLDLLAPKFRSYLYLFSSNLVDFIDSPLPVLDRHVFTEDDRPTLIVVCDEDIYLRGLLLTITGINSREQAVADLPATKGRQLARVQTYRSQALENLNWIGFQLDRLTPLHFLVERVNGTAGELDRIVARHLLHLCILFTANRSTFDAGKFTSTYASSDSSVKLELESDVDPPDSSLLLARVVVWPYGGERQDRLVIFQTVVARALAGDDAKENYGLFTEQLPRILNDARWHHRVYIDGQIDEHFQQVQSVTDYVSEMTGEVSKSLDSLTKGFVDTLLATIGVIVLTLLASLVEGETDNVIFRVGMLAYVAYLLLFQGFYRLGSIWHSYHLLNRQTETWLSETAQRLGRRRIDELASPLQDRKRQFTTWFWITAGLHIAVSVLIIWLSFALPSYLRQLGIGVTTPTPTP